MSPVILSTKAVMMADCSAVGFASKSLTARARAGTDARIAVARIAARIGGSGEELPDSSSISSSISALPGDGGAARKKLGQPARRYIVTGHGQQLVVRQVVVIGHVSPLPRF
jgi:hypothetical protein